jgi:hypothetical protein
MQSIPEAHMPTSPHCHQRCVEGFPKKHPREPTPAPEETLQHGNNYINVNASKSSPPCDFHRFSHLEKQPHCSGVQVHLHNHACHSTTKGRHSTPKHTCVSQNHRPSHTCGHDKNTTHACFEPLKAPYPHSGRCSVNIDPPQEPENHKASDTAKRHHDSRYECYGHQSVPVHRADVTCHRVWGPPLPVWCGGVDHVV